MRPEAGSLPPIHAHVETFPSKGLKGPRVLVGLLAGVAPKNPAAHLHDPSTVSKSLSVTAEVER
jgi:hypothetical protein